MKNIVYVPVYIEGKKDLPKEKGEYFCCRSGFMTVQKIDPNLPVKSYQREIRWYLKPTEIPDEEAMETELTRLQCDEEWYEDVISACTYTEYYFTEVQKAAFRKCYEWLISKIKE